MKNEFTLAFNEVLEEKGLPKEVILSALESAMVSAYRRAVNASTGQQVEAKVDIETGKVTIFAEKEVVEVVQDERTEVSLEEARRYDPDAELGSLALVESTPKDFGRVAAQTARQVIQQRIRDAERQAQLDYYEKQLGEIVSGVVQAVNSQGLTIGLEMKAEGNMPRKEMIPGERFRIHDRVRALVAEVKDNPRGPQIILSRTHRNFLRRLLENEVPEIYHGIVEIRSIAREPGERAKVAVSATQQGIDPVGACVGMRGVRIQAIVRELHDEKIDVIEWNPDPAVFIAKAISPARVSGVYLNERAAGGKTATVVVSEDQLSLAIGRDGQNARLAAKLTGWRIDIKSISECASDTLYKLQNDPALEQILEAEQKVIPQVEEALANKASGRPLAPEDYDLLIRFIDRVEKRIVSRAEAARKVSEDKLAELRSSIPAQAFETNILDSDLPEHISIILQEAGFETLGDLALQMKKNSDEILRLNGIGPKAMQTIEQVVASLEAAPEAEAEAEAGPVEAEVEAAAPEEIITEQPVEAGAVEAELTAEEVAPAAQEEAPAEEPAPAAESEEEVPFDALFSLATNILPVEPVEEEEEPVTKGKKKGKKKKKKHVQVEYDPESDQTVVTRKRKRGDDGWDWDV